MCRRLCLQLYCTCFIQRMFSMVSAPNQTVHPKHKHSRQTHYSHALCPSFVITGQPHTKTEACSAVHNVTLSEHERVRRSTALYPQHTQTHTEKHTHSGFGYGPHPACVCTSQINMETSSTAAISAVPSAAPVEK